MCFWIHVWALGIIWWNVEIAWRRSTNVPLLLLYWMDGQCTTWMKCFAWKWYEVHAQHVWNVLRRHENVINMYCEWKVFAHCDVHVIDVVPCFDKYVQLCWLLWINVCQIMDSCCHLVNKMEMIWYTLMFCFLSFWCGCSLCPGDPLYGAVS